MTDNKIVLNLQIAGSEIVTEENGDLAVAIQIRPFTMSMDVYKRLVARADDNAFLHLQLVDE